MADDIILELVRIERRAVERVRERNALLQQGQAFQDLEREAFEYAFQASQGEAR